MYAHVYITDVYVCMCFRVFDMFWIVGQIEPFGIHLEPINKWTKERTVQHKKFFGPMVCHINLSKALMCVCMYVCMYVCTCTCVCMFVCMYIVM